MGNTCLINHYHNAKDTVINAGYEYEISWQLRVAEKPFEESDLLRETAWVILASGFKTAIVEKFFNYISLCFHDWESSELIVQDRHYCTDLALQRFQNHKKIEALAQVAHYVHEIKFDLLRQQIMDDPFSELQKLPYIGGITVWHLMKNLGIQVAKPDRHLVRIAQNYGFVDVQEFCSNISEKTSDPVSVVDLVLWRYATLDKHYLTSLSRRMN